MAQSHFLKGEVCHLFFFFSVEMSKVRYKATIHRLSSQMVQLLRLEFVTLFGKLVLIRCHYLWHKITCFTFNSENYYLLY